MSIEQIFQQLESLYPDVSFVKKSRGSLVLLEFESVLQQDYFYGISLNSESFNVSIYAKLKNGKNLSYFWYYPFAPYGSESEPGKEEDILEFLQEVLPKLLNHRTRIIQKKGLINYSFECQFEDQEEWRSLYKHWVLKRVGGIPNISARRKVYS